MDVGSLFYFYFKIYLLFIMWLLHWDSYKKQRWRCQVTLISLKIMSHLKWILGSWDIWYSKKENIKQQ